MKNENLFSELGLALARGDVGLWIGPDGVPLTDANHRLITQEWLGVWAEPRQAEFAQALEHSWRERSSARMVIEVPDLVEDALGEHFKFSDFCPYFYLNGRGPGTDKLSPLRREDSKRDKSKFLEPLGASVLLICGYRDPAQLASLLGREVGEYGAKLRLVVLTGCTEQELAQLTSNLSVHRANLVTRILATDASVTDLLDEIEEKKATLPAEPSVRVGDTSILLKALLRTQPPIDQDFIIVTEQDVRRPEAHEEKAQMLADLLAGRQPPWRAFAHGLAWDRGTSHLKDVLDGLDRMRKDDLAVLCLDIPVEPGAGATVLLQQIAFETARRAYPCLLHRPFGSEVNYDLLRRFLTDLQHEAGTAKGSPSPIAVLLFDTPSVEGDSKSLLEDLPARLSRDGRRALVIRGIPVRRISEAGEATFKRNHEVRTRGGIEQKWLSPIPASLTGDDQYKLAEWADKHFEQAGQPLSKASLDTIRNWDDEEQQVPLLICLYFILTDEFRSKAGLGKHLTDRLKKLLPAAAPSEERVPDDGARPATRAELLAAFGQPGTLGPRFISHVQADRDDIASIFFTLAALGSLRLGAPRDVLDAIAGVERDKVHSAIALLERNDLALTDLPVDVETNGGDFKKRTDDRLAPLAFYTVKETVGLRHPAYGRLILDWLRSPEGREDRQQLTGKGQAAAFLKCSEWGQSDVERRFRLLEPILSALRPSAAQSKFAADLSVRFLRLQKRDRSDEIYQFQWQNRTLVRDAYSWLNESVVRQSAVTLHSRGITRYKTCFPSLPMEECRQRYMQAEGDLKMALELARRHESSEHPGNIITSLGLLYLGWAERARQEGQRPGGNDDEWRSVDSRVERTLREGLQERRDNPYAACGLARYLLERCKRVLHSDAEATPTERAACAQDLSEALELLQIEPEAYFAAEYHELWLVATGLLEGDEAQLLIRGLKKSGDELGYALDCMKVLNGRIPTDPTVDRESIKSFQIANSILLEAKTLATAKKCPFADLLRYALFSADPERLRTPAFDQRFKLLEPLRDTRYLEQPIWRFDYGMLAFQVGRYPEGSESFAWLRKNGRFFEVPRERSQLLTESPTSLKPMRVTFRIVVPGAEGERGSGRVEQPVRFRDPVPFSARAFLSRGKGVSPGTVTSCFIRMNPAGPFAEPESR